MISNYKKYFLIIFIIFISKQKNHQDKNKNIILQKGRNYLDFCLQGVNKKIFFYFNKKPKISVIIPIYNCQKSINLTIISIQNQIIKDYEIILVNDYSKDNSKQIIDNIQKNEPRIVIINNKKNMGTLYSRNIGVLGSRGKYIFPLDNDDMLFNPKIFRLLYKEAINNNYDIVGFKTIYGLDYHSNVKNMFDEPFIRNKSNKVVYQPKLKFLSINNNDCHIWGKLIRNDIYKKAINLMGIKRYSVYLCFAEDDIMVFMIFSSAKSFKYLPIYGLFHLKSKNTASFTLSQNHKLFSKIYFLEILFDFTNNNFKEKSYVSNFAIFLSKIFNYKTTSETRIYLKQVLNKILNCDFIEKKQKKIIISSFKKYIISQMRKLSFCSKRKCSFY